MQLALSMEVFPDCATLALHQGAPDGARKTRQRAHLRAGLHPPLGHLERRHALAPVPARLGADGAAGAPVDLSKGLDADIPAKPFGGDEDYAFSPDGSTLVFSARIAGRTEPWSTNFDLFQVPVDGSAAPVNLTADNPAWDAQPVFLANGDLAWLAQDRPGLRVRPLPHHAEERAHGAVRALTAAWDRSVARLGATADGTRCWRAPRTSASGAVPIDPRAARAQARRHRRGR